MHMHMRFLTVSALTAGLCAGTGDVRAQGSVGRDPGVDCDEWEPATFPSGPWSNLGICGLNGRWGSGPQIVRKLYRSVRGRAHQ